MKARRIGIHLRKPSVAIAASLSLAGLLLAGGTDAANPPGAEKMMRQIGVMEKIVDKVLLDSPNFLVHRGDNTRGLYLEGYGVVFTFDANLTSPIFDFSQYFSEMGKSFEITTNEDGDEVIVLKKGNKGKKEAEAKAEADAGEEDEEGEKARSRENRYEGGKNELIQTLLDYGETMTLLRDNEWVVIAAFMQESDFFKERNLSRFILKAKIEDLRAHAEGEISVETARSRIVIQEF